MRKQLAVWCWLPIAFAMPACDQKFFLIADDRMVNA